MIGMGDGRTGRFAVGLVTVAVLAFVPAAARAAGWHVVSSPSPQPYVNTLDGVARVPGTTRYWAVGSTDTSNVDGVTTALIEHESGGVWSTTATHAGGAESNLQGVAALGPRNAWAAGSVTPVGDPPHALVEHWNGLGWAPVTLPLRSGELASQLYAIRVFSRSDVLAAGYSEAGSGAYSALLYHWNGSRWGIVDLPAPSGCQPSLAGLSGVPRSSQRWAVGTCYQPNGSGSSGIIYHYTGSWAITPVRFPAQSGLAAVTPLSASDVWAVGTAGTNTQPLAMHWNGAAWTAVTTPITGTFGGLSSVIRIPGTMNLWAVGQTVTGGVGEALVYYWNGTKWVTRLTVGPGHQSGLDGVASSGPTDTYAVGDYLPTSGVPFRRTLVLHH